MRPMNALLRGQIQVAPLPGPLVAKAVDEALLEDLGLVGDVTTNATIPAAATARALRMHRRTLQRKLAKRRSVD